jgi:lipid A 3-O-deacylase
MNKDMKNRVVALLFIFVALWSQKLNATPMNQEIRVGVLRHDVKSELKHVFEKGYDVNLEYLFATPCNSFFDFIFSPRPHVGTSINTRGGTNQFYAGVTWHVDFLSCLWVEVNFGGETHNAKLKHRSKKHKALGSRLLFREGIALGVQFATHHSVSVLLDHASNARLAKPNPGLTGFGIRYGYLF